MMAVEKITTLRGDQHEAEPMSRHTTWRVGGNAEHYYRPADLDDLCDFLQQMNINENLFWVGLGSNLLVRDGGLRGTVIHTSGRLNELSLLDETTVRAEAGVSCAKVARLAARNGLVGAEFLAGIPGTMGGALAMNAGAFGGETWRIVKSVETVNKQGQRVTHVPADYEISYRTVKGKDDEWFVSADLSLTKGDVEKAQQAIKKLLAKRAATQPTSQASCGSVFRNPDGDYAARLIEDSGLKGFCIGNACVSEKHANFIINTGDARATDIEALIKHIAEIVKKEHNITLQTEVKIVGEDLA